MGLPGWLHWTAWFTKSFLFMIISVTLMVALFKIDAWYDENVPAVLPKCNFILLFIFLVLFIIATITLCFAISVFFNKGNKKANVDCKRFILNGIISSKYGGWYRWRTILSVHGTIYNPKHEVSGIDVVYQNVGLIDVQHGNVVRFSAYLHVRNNRRRFTVGQLVQSRDT